MSTEKKIRLRKAKKEEVDVGEASREVLHLHLPKKSFEMIREAADKCNQTIQDFVRTAIAEKLFRP